MSTLQGMRMARAGKSAFGTKSALALGLQPAGPSADSAAESIPICVNSIIGARAVHAPQPPAIPMNYWRSLLNPALRQLPEPLLANQLEEVQAALRDALHLLKEKNHA
jgi:hypothetical protein